MRFSVIVPVYKVEKYLPQCVESILTQTFRDFELILVDDGSPDSCPALCDDFARKDDRVKVIHKTNGGPSDARNAGIDIAQGDYLLFLDSDDYWNTTAVLQTVNDTLVQDSYDILQFGFQKRHANKEEPESAEKRNTFAEYGESSTYLLRAVREKQLMVAAYSVVISRTFLLAHALYFVKGIKSEDIEWAVRLFAEKPDVLFMKESFYIYRVARKGSITATINEKSMEDYCNILESSVTGLLKKQDKALDGLMSYLMYQTTIAIALCAKLKLPRVVKKAYRERLKAVAKHMNKYNEDPRVKMVLPFYRVGGFSGMSAVLGFYLKHRGR